MGSLQSHNEPMGILKQNWQEKSHNTLQNTITKQLIYQGILETHNTQQIGNIKYRINLNNPYIVKLLYYEKISPKVCQQCAVQVKYRMYTTMPQYTLQQYINKKIQNRNKVCKCIMLCRASLYLYQKYGPFRIINNIWICQNGIIALWIHSKLQQCNIQINNGQFSMIEDIKNIIHQFINHRICSINKYYLYPIFPKYHFKQINIHQHFNTLIQFASFVEKTHSMETLKINPSQRLLSQSQNHSQYKDHQLFNPKLRSYSGKQIKQLQKMQPVNKKQPYIFIIPQNVQKKPIKPLKYQQNKSLKQQYTIQQQYRTLHKPQINTKVDKYNSNSSMQQTNSKHLSHKMHGINSCSIKFSYESPQIDKKLIIDKLKKSSNNQNRNNIIKEGQLISQHKQIEKMQNKIPYQSKQEHKKSIEKYLPQQVESQQNHKKPLKNSLILNEHTQIKEQDSRLQRNNNTQTINNISSNESSQLLQNHANNISREIQLLMKQKFNQSMHRFTTDNSPTKTKLHHHQQTSSFNTVGHIGEQLQSIQQIQTQKPTIISTKNQTLRSKKAPIKTSYIESKQLHQLYHHKPKSRCLESTKQRKLQQNQYKQMQKIYTYQYPKIKQKAKQKQAKFAQLKAEASKLLY